LGLADRPGIFPRVNKAATISHGRHKKNILTEAKVQSPAGTGESHRDGSARHSGTVLNGVTVDAVKVEMDTINTTPGDASADDATTAKMVKEGELHCGNDG